MNRRQPVIKTIFIFLFCLHCARFTFAQNKPDSAFFPTGFRTAILPATITVYGVLAQNLNPFHQWNHDVQRLVSKGDYGNHTPVESYLQWAPALAVYALDLSGTKPRHDLVDRTGIYVMTLLLQAVPVYLIKKGSGETRPNGQGRESFPSGHTANAFAAAEFLRTELGQHSVWISVSGYLCATAVASLRLYHNRHWLGDVVAGAGIGILAADLSYILYPVIKKWLSGRPVHEAIVL